MGRNYGRDLWDELCECVAEDDGLPVFESSGFWTADKLYFVCQYLEQTTRGMKNRPHWKSGLTYIDLFSGSGISAVRDSSGKVHRYPGSPLIAASTPSPFDRLILAERDPSRLDALITRLGSTGFQGDIISFLVDSNESIADISAAVPTDSLNVAFVDPYSLDVHFETIKQLASTRALDLILLFSDRFDLGRNVHRYYYPQEEQSKLDHFLGTTDWRQRLDQLDNQSGQGVRELFARIYSEQLQTIDYNHIEHWPLEGPNGPAFRLFFASKHQLGLKYCRIALSESRQDGRGLFS